MMEGSFVLVMLTFLNVLGVRETSTFNEILGALHIASESAILFFGFLFAFNPTMLIHQMTTAWPDPFHLAYGASLAIISFVGLESISQASQETIRPGKVVPRASSALILTMLIYALAFSNLGLAMLPWQSIVAHNADRVAWLASHIPILGLFAGPYVAMLGATLMLNSANSGVFGGSRITYWMARFNLLPHWFAKVHPKFGTPVRSLVVFSGIAMVELWLSGLSSNVYDTLANMYAFGAATAYMLVFVSLLALRFKDPWTPRPFKVPLNIRLRGKDGETRLLPIAGVLGFLGISSILFLFVLTHSLGRIAVPGWIVLWLLIYFWHRRRNKLPFRKTLKRDWTKEQLDVYEDAGEYELADELRENLERKRRLGGELQRESVLPDGAKELDVPIHASSSSGHRRKHRGGAECKH